MDENKKEEMNTGTETPEVTEVVEETEVATSEVTQAPAVAPTQEPQNSNNLWIAIVAIFGAVFIAGAVFYMNQGAPDADGAALVVRGADYVLATVNGEAIYQKDLDTRLSESAQQLAAQGVDLSDATVRADVESQLLDDIIAYKLLVQASADADIEVSPTDVSALIEGYIQQFGGEEVFATELEKIGLTQDSFREKIVEQQRLQQYISENVPQVEITDEDIAAFYASVVAGQEGAPALADVSEQIAAQLSAEAQQKEVVSFVDTLREEAEIEVN